jgi:hypothetical protein
MKEKIENTNFAIREIITSSLTCANSEEICATGKIENLSRILRYFRKRKLNPKPYLFEEICLSENLSFTFRNELLYQFGPGNFRNLTPDDDFILLFSSLLASKLKTESVWCIDGTFKVVPRPYYQMVTISILKHATVFPIIFAICKNKYKYL